MTVVSSDKVPQEGESSGKVVTMTAIKGGKDSSASMSVLDTYSYGKLIRQHVKEFGALFGVIFLVIAAFQCFKGRSFEVVSLVSLAGIVIAFLGYKAPAILYPLWKGWMAFAHVLGIASTFILLSLSWIIVVLPIAFLMKAIGKTVMKMGYKEKVDSYWEVRSEDSHDFKLLERQF